MPANGQRLAYELYGLADQNPYRPRPLDPINNPDDRELRLDLDGHVKIEPIHAYLKAAADQGQPAFIVVKGRDHTGRTSVANCILDLYRELRHVDRLLVSGLEVRNHYDFEWIQQAMAQLQNEVETAEVTLTDSLVESLEAIGNVPQSIYRQRFQAIARRLSTELAHLPSPIAFGVLFESMPTASLIDAAQTVFRNAPAVIVFTHGDYLHAQTSAPDLIEAALFNESIHVVQLLPLASRQVWLLTEGRWQQTSELTCPFDSDGIHDIFRNAPVPIKAALRKLASLLDYKLGIARKDAPWPDNDELEMSRQWLVETVAAMDNWSK